MAIQYMKFVNGGKSVNFSRAYSNGTIEIHAIGDGNSFVIPMDLDNLKQLQHWLATQIATLELGNKKSKEPNNKQ